MREHFYLTSGYDSLKDAFKDFFNILLLILQSEYYIDPDITDFMVNTFR